MLPGAAPRFLTAPNTKHTGATARQNLPKPVRVLELIYSLRVFAEVGGLMG